MKKIITGLFAIAAFTFSVNAQDHNAQGHKKMHKENQGMHNGHDGMDGLDKLNLTEAQRQQIKVINEDFKNKLQALNNNDNLMVKDAKVQRKALMEDRKSRIAAILTPEQKIQAQQLRKEHNNDDLKKKSKGEDWKQKRKMENGNEKVKVKKT